MTPTRKLAAATVLLLAGCGGPAQQPMPTGALADAADQRAVRAVGATEPGKTCVAQAFGLRPPGAAAIDQVSTVYAWVYCYDKRDGSGDVMPAAIGRDGTASIPGDADYAGDLDRIFPEDVRGAATDEPQSMVDLVASLG